MPLYEYECDQCGHRFEQIQKFSDPQVETCPKCGGKVHKLISSPAFQFKGTGWYVTDYAGKGRSGGESSDKDAKPAAKSDSTSATSDGGGESKKSDAPAATPPAKS